MKLSTILSSALFAGLAIAAPLTEERRARSETRRKTLFPHKPDSDEILEVTNTTQVQYSSNWAGAVLIGSDYTTVTGEFTVPSPSVPPGGSSYQQYCASAWVGIDGDTCQSAILQTGVDFCVRGGYASFDAWYEWFPDYMYTFSGITISAGDRVKLTVAASSMVSGTATVENMSNGQSVTHTFNGNVQGSLCETNAEWIVEDFSKGGQLVPFADFGDVTFSNAYVEQNGRKVGPQGAAIMDIKQNGQVLTNAEVSGGEVSVSYI